MLTLPKIIQYVKYFWLGYTDKEYNHHKERLRFLEQEIKKNNYKFDFECSDDYWYMVNYVNRLELFLYKKSLVKIMEDNFGTEASLDMENMLSCIGSPNSTFSEIFIDMYPKLLDMGLKYWTLSLQ